jgi:hypothetical protein
LAAAKLAISAHTVTEKDEVRIKVRLENTGPTAAIETKLTLLAGDGKTRVLPAYYSDNYVSLLPGESKEIEIATPKSVRNGGLKLGLRGWNSIEQTVAVEP